MQFGNEKKLAETMKDVLAGRDVGGDLASRLEMAGLIHWVDGKYVPSCQLYEEYFKMVLRVT